MSEKCYIEKCHMKGKNSRCELTEGSKSCGSWVKAPLKGDPESGANVQIDRLVMPAVVEDTGDRYRIILPDGGFYLQTKDPIREVNSARWVREIVMISLCETILKMKA